MHVVAVIQARIGSTRLPGKVAYTLDDRPVLAHVVRSVDAAATIDEVVVATSTNERDDVVSTLLVDEPATVYRGSESDVLERLFRAGERTESDVLVRICADNPLVSPTIVDAVVDGVDEGVDYASNHLERTFPVGLSVEAFTAESFAHVHDVATNPEEREHVTLYYKRHVEEFEVRNVTSETVFDDERYYGRSDLRVTLDYPADYELLSTVFDALGNGGPIDLREAISLIDEENLASVNAHCSQHRFS